MKKNIITMALIFSVLLSFAQQLGKSAIPLEDIMKMQKASDDTIWLPHNLTIYQWNNGTSIPYLINIYEYYPSTANMKSGIVIMQNDDTTQKYNFFYDEYDRVISTIIQNYTGNPENKWINTDRTDQFYNEVGWDSLYVNYTWNNTDSVWKKHSMRGFKYYYNYGERLLDTDSTCLWNGNEWVTSDGYRRDYLFNEFGQIYDLKFSLYKNNKWEYDFCDIYYLINDTTGEYNALDEFAWVDGQWQNFIKLTDVVIHNWQGFTNYALDYEHVIKQYWDGYDWIFSLNDTITYDPYGGFKIRSYAWINDKWELSSRIRDVFNERKLRTLITKEYYNNNQWDTILGSKFSFEYLGSIWKTMQVYTYDTTLMKWVPTYDHVLSDFSYILNTPETETNNSSSSLQIIPNPAKNSILIKLNDEADRIKTVRVYNVTGQSMFEKKFHGKRQQENLNISSLKNGVFILNVTTKQGKIVKGKFVKN